MRELQNVASTSEYSLLRAIALYYIGKKFGNEKFLRNYIFDRNKGDLVVKNKDITKLEMAAILNTGIPGKSNWWERLTNKEERINYIKLVLKGDFTDERNYILDNAAWVCTHFATQLAINCRGYRNLYRLNQVADKEAFEEYGYVIRDIGYGIPLYYATTFINEAEMIGMHGLNAIFIGDDINDESQRNDIKNWIFIEPQQDNFSPSLLGEEVHIHLNPLFSPPGSYYRNADKIIIKTEG